MHKKKLNLFIIIISACMLFRCIMSEKKETGFYGYIKDELGNPLGDVTIYYKINSTSTQTDQKGNYSINKPLNVNLIFEKKGYQTINANIENFSDDVYYNLDTIILKKLNNNTKESITLATKKNSSMKISKLNGTVVNAFNTPINKVKVTIVDSTILASHSSNNESDKGYFYFKKVNNILSFEKKGFRNVNINLPTHQTKKQRVILIENKNKKGVYILKSNKYIPLPSAPLTQKSEEKIGRILWGGNFKYKITDFFYPNDIEEFRLEKDSVIRLIIFDSGVHPNLFEARKYDNYLCTVNYKTIFTAFPEGNLVDIYDTKTVYPSKYSVNSNDNPYIIEFRPKNHLDSTINKYVFVNKKIKMDTILPIK